MPTAEEVIVERFNERHPIGTAVRYWTGRRQGSGELTETRTPASVLGGHTPVIWVTGHAGCIALTHIEPAREALGAGDVD